MTPSRTIEDREDSKRKLLSVRCTPIGRLGVSKAPPPPGKHKNNAINMYFSILLDIKIAEKNAIFPIKSLKINTYKIAL
jgi:hypothetical protein